MAAALLAALPPDGSPVPNRAARAILTQQLGLLISAETYFAARAQLLAKGLVGRVRGQGGSVFLLPPPAEAPEQEPASVAPSEKSLMGPLGQALATQFAEWLDLPANGHVEVLDIADNRRPGQWANPDFLLVSVCPLAVLGGAQVDVHVFELKNEAGGRIQAVHEALAHRRFAHFSHLVWYVPRHSPRELELEAIAAHCRLHGVGLIRLLEVSPVPQIEVLVDPVRSTTSPLEIDGFVESRLSPDLIAGLRKRMGAEHAG